MSAPIPQATSSLSRLCCLIRIGFRLFVTVSLLAGSLAAQIDKDALILELGKPVERELRGGQAHSYRILLTSGQYIHIVVDQRGIDVVVALFGPDGKRLTEVDSPNGTLGPEPIYWITDASGTYRLEVRSDDKAVPAGRYQAKIEELRTARTPDRNSVAAERTFIEGQKLFAQATPESSRKAIEKYKESLLLRRNSGDQSGEALTLSTIGDVYSILDEKHQALDFLNRALPLWRAVGDRSGEAYTLGSIGMICHDLGEPQKAVSFLNQALPLMQALGDRSGEALARGHPRLDPRDGPALDARP